MSPIKPILGLLVVAAAAFLIVLQYQTQQKLRAENELLRQQIAQLKSASQDAPAASSNPPVSDDLNDLLRLRGEVNSLRSQTNQIAKLETQNQQLKNSLAAAKEQKQASDEETAKRKAFSILQLNTSRQYVLGMINYARDHQGQFPASFDQVSAYIQDSTVLTNLHRFEMVYTGSYSTIANPSSAIVVRETEPRLSNGKWLRTYSFADGHSEVHGEDSADKLDAWEQQRVPVFTAPALMVPTK